MSQGPNEHLGGSPDAVDPSVEPGQTAAADGRETVRFNRPPDASRSADQHLGPVEAAPPDAASASASASGAPPPPPGGGTPPAGPPPGGQPPAGPPPGGPPPEGPPPGGGQPPAGPPPGGQPPAGSPPGGPPPGAPPPGGQPPAGPPPGGPEASGKGRLGLILGVIGGAVVVAALGIGGFLAFSAFTADTAEASVLLEPIDEPGPDVFTDPVAPEAAGSLADYAEHGEPGEPDPDGVPGFVTVPSRAADIEDVSYQVVDADETGLYGGSLDEASCDVEQLAGFLAQDAQKAAAWADVIGIEPADIATYLDGLTPVNLGEDTRVTNHGFADGEPTPREAVLQRGTAVLVDDAGVPRVRCYCGNPLLEPAVSGSEEYEGAGWSAFDPGNVRLVDAADAPIEEFELFDVRTGSQILRPVGSRGEMDTDPRPEPEPEPEPEEEPEPEPEPEPEEDDEPQARTAEESCGVASESFFGETIDAAVFLPEGTTLTCDEALAVGEGYLQAFIAWVESVPSVDEGEQAPTLDFDGWTCEFDGELQLRCDGPPGGPVLLREP